MTGANRYSFITSTILPARRTVSSYVRASLAWSSSGGGLLDVKWLFWFSQNCELHVLSGFSSSVPYGENSEPHGSQRITPSRRWKNTLQPLTWVVGCFELFYGT